MSSCSLSPQGCREIAQALPRLVVEVIKDEAEVNRGECEEHIDDAFDILYMYRSLEGPRDDAPHFVTILH